MAAMRKQRKRIAIDTSKAVFTLHGVVLNSALALAITGVWVSRSLM
jgi:hypothetical protein